MNSTDKVLAVVLAADETEHHSLPDPVLHSLVYELSIEKLSFPTYHFKTISSPLDTGNRLFAHPNSRELDEDLYALVLSRQLQQHWSVLTYTVTDSARAARPALVQQWAAEEPLLYETLRETVAALLEDAAALVNTSYHRYIAQLSGA